MIAIQKANKFKSTSVVFGAFLALGLGMAAPVAHASGEICNSDNSPNPLSGLNILNDGLGGFQQCGQSFTPGAGNNYSCTGLTLPFVAAGVGQSVTVTLLSDNGGKPGTVLNSGTFTSTGVTLQDCTINFTAATNLTAGTTYWVDCAPTGLGLFDWCGGSGSDSNLLCTIGAAGTDTVSSLLNFTNAAVGVNLGLKVNGTVSPSGTPTPEPASYAAFAMGGLGLLGLGLRKRKHTMAF